jgi:hypothetical protein
MMDLNSKQKRILQIGVILIALSVMFPPWRYEDGWTSAERPAGYHFVFGGVPKVKPQAEMREIFSIPEDGHPHGFSIKPDLPGLFGQFFIILLSAVGLMLIFSEQRTLVKIIFGGASICAGLLIMGLYLGYVTGWL